MYRLNVQLGPVLESNLRTPDCVRHAQSAGCSCVWPMQSGVCTSLSRNGPLVYEYQTYTCWKPTCIFVASLFISMSQYLKMFSSPHSFHRITTSPPPSITLLHSCPRTCSSSFSASPTPTSSSYLSCRYVIGLAFVMWPWLENPSVTIKLNWNRNLNWDKIEVQVQNTWMSVCHQWSVTILWDRN